MNPVLFAGGAVIDDHVALYPQVAFQSGVEAAPCPFVPRFGRYSQDVAVRVLIPAKQKAPARVDPLRQSPLEGSICVSWDNVGSR